MYYGIVVLLAAFVGTQAATIWGISPSRGSIRGGTVVSIFGSGFNRNGQQGSTRVFFGVDECIQEPYYSTDTQFVCYAPPHLVNEYVPVKMSVIAIESLSQYAICSVSGGCYFQYSSYLTPQVDTGSLGGAFQDLYRGQGQFFYPSNGVSDLTDFRIMAGDQQCAVKDQPITQLSNAIACYLPELEAGYYNITWREDDPSLGLGYATMNRRTKQVRGSDGTIFHYTHHPRVDSLSYSSTGLGGGTELVITGSGFSWNVSENTVEVAGYSCMVTTATSTEIRCIPPAVSASTPFNASGPIAYGAGRGLLHKVWTTVYSYNTLSPNWAPYNPPAWTYINTDSLRSTFFESVEADYYLQDMSGFFVPPVSANYSFYLIADDIAGVWLSTDQSAANASLVAYTNSWTSNFYTYPTQISTPRYLTAGKKYYFKARHQEGGGGDYLYVGLRVHTANNSDAAAMFASENQRIFQSLAEIQMVQIFTDIVREVQVIVVANAKAGQWGITSGGTTVMSGGQAIALAVNATANDVWTAVAAADTYCGSGNIGVARSAVPGGWAFTIRWNCPSRTPNPAIVPFSLSLQPQMGMTLNLSSTRTVARSAPADGYYLLQLGNYTTGPISYGAANWEVQNALQALPGVSDVVVTGSTTNVLDGATWIITFNKPYGNLPLLQPIWNGTIGNDSFSTLLGSNPRMVATEILQGSSDPFFYPAPMAPFFETGLPVPTVRVKTHGILAACNTTNFNASNMACAFRYDAALTAYITGVSATTITAGDVIVINGTGFLTASDGYGKGIGGTDVPIWQLNKVWFNSSLCNVTAASSTSLTCVVNHGAAGTYPVRVEIGFGRGFALTNSSDGSPFYVTYPLRVDSISPTSGSHAGGTVITISGTGFQANAANNTVTVGGVACAISSSSFSVMTCLTPYNFFGNYSSTAVAQVVANGVVLPVNFTYTNASTPTITSVSRRFLSSGISGTINVTVDGVPSGSFVSISWGPVTSTGYVPTRFCRSVANYTLGNNQLLVSCVLARALPKGIVQPLFVPIVTIGNWGYAEASNNTVDLGLRVTNVSAVRGSRMGGLVVTFTGQGFGPILDQNSITFTAYDNLFYQYYKPCVMNNVSADGTTMTCTTQAVPDYFSGPRANWTTAIPGYFMVKVNNITAVCAGGCNFTYDPDATPTVTAGAEVLPGIFEINGTLLTPPESLAISLGMTPCTNPVLSDSSIRCTINAATGGMVSVSVVSSVYGSANVSSMVSYTYAFNVSQPVNLTAGSSAGGQPITVSGVGFAVADLTRNIVLFGGSSQAVVTAATFTTLTFLTPPRTSVTSTTTATVGITVILMDSMQVNSVGQYDFANVYTYSGPVTPTITSFAPTSGTQGTRIRLKGTHFGGNSTSANPTTVTIGGAPCAVDDSKVNATYLECVVGTTPAGSHRIIVNVAGIGYARQASPEVRFNSLLSVTGVSQSISGIGGGSMIRFYGSGFATLDGKTVGINTITVCNTNYTVVAATYDTVTALSAPLITRAGLSQYPTMYSPMVLTGAVTPKTVANAFDGSAETAFTGCTVTLDVGQDSLAIVTSVGFYPRFHLTNYMLYGIFSASVDNINFVQLAQITTSLESWNRIHLYNGPGMNVTDLGTLPGYRYLRFKFAGTGGTCSANELAFYGIPVAVTAPDGSCRTNISVQATPTADQLPYTSTVAVVKLPIPTSNISISYPTDSNSVPWVTGISPNNGSALGGDMITITGTGFGNDPTAVTVSLNSMSCMVMTASNNTITCMTMPRMMIMPISVNVTIGGVNGTGTALVDTDVVYFRYLDRWSALTTWKWQEPPMEGDSVYIPPGQSILVDMSPPRLFLVLNQGEMIFDRQDLTFDATYIWTQGGRFEIGTERDPFLNKITITLHGDRFNDIEIPEVGVKVLAVMNRGGTMQSMEDGSMSNMNQAFSQGVMEIHGRPRKRVWTKLAQSAYAGTDMVYTIEDTDFEVGDHVAITASGTGASGESEERIIAQVYGPRQYRLTQPLAYDHISQIYPAGKWGHSDVDMRVEIGLITRNVVIRGDDNSDSQLFGCHTGAFHGGVFRIENAEVHHCGQGYLLGRYSIHFHMLSNTNNYARYNSVHDSFQRVTTIHATNYLRVQHNFGFRIRGHGIFVEDGVEQYNVIEENLVVSVRPSYASLESDLKPAAFWMASPTNFWRHNVAVGCSHDGYWFEPPGAPHGPSYTPGYCPVGMPMGEFFNNTAHSNGVHGLRIYPSYLPTVDPCNGNSPGNPQYFYNFTSWGNGAHGIFGKLDGDLHHINSKLIANGQYGIQWEKYDNAARMQWNPHLKDVLFVCTLDPARNPCALHHRAVEAFQQEWWFADGLTIVNYGAAGALAGCSMCSSDTEYKQGGYTYRWQRLTWENTTVRTYWNDPKKDIFWDLDGTLSDVGPNTTVVPYWGWNNAPECPRDMVGTYQYGHVCNSSVQVRRIQIDNVLPSNLYWMNMNVSSNFGWSALPFRPKEIYGWVYPAVNRYWYKHGFIGSLSDWRTVSIRYSEPEYLLSDDWTGSTWTWIDYRYSNLVSYGPSQLTRPFLPAPDRPDPTVVDFGTGNLPDGNNTWHVVLNTHNISQDYSPYDRVRFSVKAVQCPPNGCIAPPAMNLGNATLWSDPNSWPNRTIPVAGASVVINSSQYIIMDVNPPQLKWLTIEGRLEFLDNGPRLLRAESIIVWGELVVGTQDNPFMNPAEIVLSGDRYADAVIVDNNIFVSNKVLAVFGKVSFVGFSRPITWTRLNSTILPNATSMVVTQNVANSWYVNDRVIISGTEWNHTQSETVTITNVDATGRIITFTPALKYRHYAGPVAASGPGSNQYMRATVGLLTRNVVFRGNLTSPSDTYGAHIFVSTVNRPNAAGVVTRRSGSIVFQHVEIRNCGKQLTEYASIHFQYGNFLFDPNAPASANPPQIINGISLSDGFNSGILSMATRNIYINGTVMSRGYRNSLDFDEDSANITITNNLIVNNLQSPDVNVADQTPWARPAAGILIKGTVSALAQMSGNVVAATWDAGFVFRPETCATAGTVIFNNEAHSNRVGVFVLATAVNGGCAGVSGFTVWKAAHIGILGVDHNTNTIVKNSYVADSHIAISLNFFKASSDLSYSRIDNTIVVGASLASVARCDSQTLACRVVTPEVPDGSTCNSVFGPSFRHVGVVIPQYTNRAKTCALDGGLNVCDPPNTPERMCSMPWEKRFGLPSTASTRFYMDNVTFIGFNGTDCGRQSVAVAFNPSQSDMAVPTYTSRITWGNTPLDARFWNGMNVNTPEKCFGFQECPSFQYINIQDTDGTFAQTGTSTSILADNPMIAYPSPTCSIESAWPGIICPNIRMVSAVAQGITLDSGHINLGSLRVTRWIDPNDNNTWLTSLGYGPHSDDCAKRFYFQFYPHILENNRTNELMWLATEPEDLSYYFLSSDPNDGAVISMFVQRAYAWQLFVDGVEVKTMQPTTRTQRPLPTDPAGTFLFDPQGRRLWFTVRGGKPNRQYLLIRTAAVQLNLNLAVSAEQFFGADLVSNLAMLLQIDPNRIRIVQVQAGSVNVQVEIRDNAPSVLVNASVAAANNMVAAGNTDPAGGLGIALGVIQVNSTVPTNSNATSGTNSTSNSTTPTTPTTTTTTDFAAAAQAQQERLNQLTQQIVTLVQTGQMNNVGGYTVTGISVQPPPTIVSNSSGSSTASGSTPIVLVPPKAAETTSAFTPGVIAGIAIGSILFVMVALGLVWMYRRSSGAGGSSRILSSKQRRAIAPMPISEDPVPSATPIGAGRSPVGGSMGSPAPGGPEVEWHMQNPQWTSPTANLMPAYGSPVAGGAAPSSFAGRYLQNNASNTLNRPPSVRRNFEPQVRGNGV